MLSIGFGPDRLHDLSYYKGRLYLYFGVTPALMLFWPFVALTGHYLFHRLAVMIFCAIGFLASAGLLRALWRRYFADVSVWVVAAGALALGLATGVPVLLPRSDVYEVAISCGYMLTMLALGAIWCALHEPERRWRWLAAASVAYGLAVGARPSLLFGAVILLVPVAQAWRERRRIWAILMAAIGPITLIGLGLMLYNAMRFDSPFEFGQHYQLTGVRPIARQFFRLRYLWFNFRVYFLEPARWSARFPFVHEITVPPLPAGYALVENPFGVLANIPLVWLALAVPLAWRSRTGQEASALRWFVAAVALLFGMCALTLCSTRTRSSATRWTSCRHCCCWRWLASLDWSARWLSQPGLAACGTLGLGPAAGLLGGIQPVGERWALRRGARQSGDRFAQTGRIEEAIAQYEQALRINPDYAEAHNNLGVAPRRDGCAARLHPARGNRGKCGRRRKGSFCALSRKAGVPTHPAPRGPPAAATAGPPRSSGQNPSRPPRAPLQIRRAGSHSRPRDIPHERPPPRPRSPAGP